MCALKDVRKEIDVIDDELVSLFVRRQRILGEVAAAKRASGGPIADPARERAILYRVTTEVPPEFENGARLFFSTLFSISKARQREILKGVAPLTEALAESAERLKGGFPNRAYVACCGTEGSYAQQATTRLFKTPSIVYFNSFESVFEAVEKKLCPYGVLPIENSAAGSVTAVYDLMRRHRFHIVRALRLKVDHVLLAPRGVRLEDVREIHSHPHALAQCGRFLKSLPAARAVPSSNTAVAAKAVAESGRQDVAVIASRACAELYGLNVLAEGIQDVPFNYTRFICIARDLEVYPDANKISLMMTLPHRPGSLHSIIAKFAAIDVNLTKLESRPLPGLDFEFSFVFDFEASPGSLAVRSLLAELSQDPEIEHFDFLGAYAEK